MDDAGKNNYDLPTDVLVEILVRLPPSCRRRVRLVCQLWRGAVDKRTPEMQRRSVKTLVYVENATRVSAYVLDDLPGWRDGAREVWTGIGDIRVIASCNGLICVCDNGKPGGALTLVNPATGETLAVPPLPRSGQGQLAPFMAWHAAYSFGYHPVTGRYKVVCVPRYVHAVSDTIAGWLDVVQVFTLGEASWRSVPLPAAVLAIGSPGTGGLISVDGTTYWLAESVGAWNVVSFDLGDERLCASPLPVTVKPGLMLLLMVVRGKLGVAIKNWNGNTNIWVLEGRRWEHRYDVELDRLERLTSPHFAHGEYVLTMRQRWREGSVLYAHRLDDGHATRSLLLRNGERMPAAAVRNFQSHIERTFTYVETTEPLSVYQ